MEFQMVVLMVASWADWRVSLRAARKDILSAASKVDLKGVQWVDKMAA